MVESRLRMKRMFVGTRAEVFSVISISFLLHHHEDDLAGATRDD